MNDEEIKGLKAFELSLSAERHFYLIGDVARLLNVKPSALRYWEERFSQLKPTRTSGNQRQYTREQVMTAYRIRYLLQEEGLTIDGARARMQHMEDPEARRIEAITRLVRVQGELGKLCDMLT